jgi:hypothetical protein
MHRISILGGGLCFEAQLQLDILTRFERRLPLGRLLLQQTVALLSVASINWQVDVILVEERRWRNRPQVQNCGCTIAWTAVTLEPTHCMLPAGLRP